MTLKKSEFSLTDLPSDFWRETLGYLLPKDILHVRVASPGMFQRLQPVHDELLTKIALTCIEKRNVTRFLELAKRRPDIVNDKLLTHAALIGVVEGDVDGLKELIKHKPDILFSKGTVTDPRGYKRYGSAYQLMRFLCDDDMLINHIAELDSVIGYEQLKAKCQEQDEELGCGGADLIKLSFPPQTCNPQSEDFKKISEFKTSYTLFDGTVHEVTFPLLENKDGLLYYKDAFQDHHFYYANPETNTIEAISSFKEEELKKNPDLKAFISAFDEMEFNSSRRSSDVEHQLIENLFHRRLQREGIVYEQNGLKYHNSRSSFEIINAYRKYIRLYQEAEDNDQWDKAYTCWCNDVRCMQGEEMWILQRFCEKRSWRPLPDNFKGFKRACEFYDHRKLGYVPVLVEGKLVAGLLDGSFALYKVKGARARVRGPEAVTVAHDLIAVNRLLKEAKANIVEFNLGQHADLQRSSTLSFQ